MVESISPDEALSFKHSVVNQTGRQSLSLSDHMAIAGAACDGAVSDAGKLVELGRVWNLGAFAGDEAAASAIWLGARQICPEQFSDEMIASGPPFPSRGSTAPQSVEISDLPEAFQRGFADLDALDELWMTWTDAVKLTVVGTSELQGQEVADVMGSEFGPPFAVNDIIGPVDDPGGQWQYWSVDIDGDGWVGTIDILESTAGQPVNNTAIQIFFERP